MINIGILCPAEIAFRRFMPSLKKCDDFNYVGIATSSLEERFNGNNLVTYDEKNKIMSNSRKKIDEFIQTFGGKRFESYNEIICSDEIDALYIPLPPALHYEYAMKALQAGKHVLIEKPATINLTQTQKLVDFASNNNIALCENYMFIFHSQLMQIKALIENGEVGKVRLYRMTFGFPYRGKEDFRYNNALGGGALLDCGGYTLKCASYFLGQDSKIVYANSLQSLDDKVDIIGSAVMRNNNGIEAHIAFGMDNYYKCDLEIWGSSGYIKSNRAYTAPPELCPEILIKKNNECQKLILQSDDTFLKSIINFKDSIVSKQNRENNYSEILQQANLINDFMKVR